MDEIIKCKITGTMIFVIFVVNNTTAECEEKFCHFLSFLLEDGDSY